MSAPTVAPAPADPTSARPDRVVVVTGASAGVGRATAVAFAGPGVAVALLARGRAGLEGAAADVRARGGTPLVVPVDVADADAVEAAAERVESELGPIDVWVNNAMTTVFARSWDVSAEEIRRATEVTYLGTVHGTMAALRRMRPRDRGRVVNVGSALAFVAIPLQSAYCGAKFAARGYTQAVREELIAEGSAVEVSMVHLPGLNTPQFGWCRSELDRHPQPVPPIYQPEVAADVIVTVAATGERSRTVGSWNWLLIRAAMVLPGVVEHFAARTSIHDQQASFAPAENQPGNLFAPVDDERDHGARGRFDELTGGVANGEFVRGLPGTAANLVRAMAARGREVVVRRGRRRHVAGSSR
ncbi:MAG TPA: SDR family oxidoreductase [Acidimicrobiales bacterium]|nr:SDR family oxidoreductase [Acidimicrobiales bacterium]